MKRSLENDQVEKFKVHSIEFDSIDYQIVLATQGGLPLAHRPYLKISEELSLSEEEVFSRIQRMKSAGFIRKIAGTPNHYKIGYLSNAMVVFDVPDEKVDLVGEILKAIGFVSHCYERPRFLPEWPYNVFAMVHAHDQDEVMEKINTLKSKIAKQYRDYTVLNSTKILKKTGIRLKAKDYV